MSTSSAIERAAGRALPLRGQDIDTDRIIPARFLKSITFDGLEKHVFEDDREQTTARGDVHPFDAPAYQGARLLFVQSNFGCGSSREHAPQALKRWGITAVVGESFAEIFFGNSMMIGLPCVGATADDMTKLIAMAESQPATEFVVDLASMSVTGGGLSIPITMPGAIRSALRTGEWDATGLLLANYAEVERVARELPYVTNFA
jgi:3-isopropylmalate/(R)-2-methylmalate dehydratase small subunit